MKIKGWDKFQHFKDRAPIWVKLYRRLLDDHEWHRLEGDSAKLLVMLWLLASENSGEVTNDISVLAFRLRVSESHIIKHLQKLSHYLIQDDISVISSTDQGDLLEKRREETEKEKNIVGSPPTVRVREEDFAQLWKAHPYGSKAEARKAYAAVAKDLKNPIPSELLAILQRQIEERKQADRNGDFLAKLPHLCRWFRHRRWEDEPYRHQEPTKEAPRQRIFSVCTVCGEAGESFVHGKCAAHEAALLG